MSLARQFKAAEAESAAEPVVRYGQTTEPSKPTASEIPTSPHKKRGPKPSGNAKVLLTLRIEPELIARYKATGPGWQRLMTDILRAARV